MPFMGQAENELLLGFDTSDDAAIYKLTDELAAVLTVDFFTPVVDDPYEFGRIAAANALSDVYAMGAQPKVALNLLALDSCLGPEVAQDILRGGADAVKQAGAALAGGHTVEDDEPKYGLSVFGTVHPDRIIQNKGAQPGDVVFLTKPIGAGIMTAAHKIGAESDQGLRPVVEAMMELNDKAAQVMVQVGVHAATDVTGFGLAGHLHEMLESSDCAAVLNWSAVPLFENVEEHSRAYCRPSRSFAIQEEAESYIEQGALADEEYDTRMGILCDPQTSGGMLVAVAADKAEEFASVYQEVCGKPAARIAAIAQGEPGVIAFA